jgi:hypothetical protein
MAGKHDLFRIRPVRLAGPDLTVGDARPDSERWDGLLGGMTVPCPIASKANPMPALRGIVLWQIKK